MTEKGWLPRSVSDAAMQLKIRPEEVRLRLGGAASVTVGKRNIRLGVTCSAKELENVLAALCSGSIHSYGDSLKNGYIDLGNGWRAGICGEAVCDGGRITAVKTVTSLSIRIPHFIEGVSGSLHSRLIKKGQITSTLIYSPPGEGKTTVLRDLAYRLSRGERPYRTALIDTRGELYIESEMSGGLLDVYSGYPKAEAIELATRTMNPECLICDEIGGIAEAEALLSAQNTGVPLIATAHASDMKSLLGRKNLRILHDAGIFEMYIGIKRRENAFDFTYTERESRDS